jgi:hypothetical protein
VGKTALLDAGCRLAAGSRGGDQLRARASQLESGFAFGGRAAAVSSGVSRAPARASGRRLLAGPAAAVRPLLLGQAEEGAVADTAFRGAARPLLARRQRGGAPAGAPRGRRRALGGRTVVALAGVSGGPAGGVAGGGCSVAVRPVEPAAAECVAVGGLRAESRVVLRPGLLSKARSGRRSFARAAGGRADDELCAALWRASGGNALYVANCCVRSSTTTGCRAAPILPS